MGSVFSFEKSVAILYFFKDVDPTLHDVDPTTGIRIRTDRPTSQAATLTPKEYVSQQDVDPTTGIRIRIPKDQPSSQTAPRLDERMHERVDERSRKHIKKQKQQKERTALYLLRSFFFPSS